MAGRFFLAKVDERPETPAPVILSEDVSPAEFRAQMRHFRQDIQFFNDRHQEFLRLYPEQWVGVYDKRVAGADPDLKTLLRDMKSRGCPLESVVVRHVSAQIIKRTLAMNKKGDMMNMKAATMNVSPDERPQTVSIRRIDLNDPEVARAMAELKVFGEDQRFFGEIYDELLERYPEKWVAVYRKEVVGADEDFGRLLKSLKSRGYPLRRLAVNRVTAKDVNLILGGELID